MEQLPLVLGIGALVLLSAVVAVRLSTRLGFPSLLMYLGIGVLLGEAGFGIRFDNVDLTQSLGLAALVMILIWRKEKNAVVKKETARATTFARMRLNGSWPSVHA